jgi:hypothetical protein
VRCVVFGSVRPQGQALGAVDWFALGNFRDLLTSSAQTQVMYDDGLHPSVVLGGALHFQQADGATRVTSLETAAAGSLITPLASPGVP